MNVQEELVVQSAVEDSFISVSPPPNHFSIRSSLSVTPRSRLRLCQLFLTYKVGKSGILMNINKQISKSRRAL